MLKYSIKLDEYNVKQEKIEWGEKYLSPDLSFVSGVTSQSYHLERLNNILVSINSIVQALPIECENVTRQGFIIIKGKEYPIDSGYTYNYVYSGTSFQCIQLNGKYYYLNGDTFEIDNWLQHDNGFKVKEEPLTISGVGSDNASVKIDTIAWIEDGIVTIDGIKYIYDFNLNGLKLYEDDKTIPLSSITSCDSMECYVYTSPTLYDYVTKFVITKNDVESEYIEDISYIKYFYYINYKNHYFTISKTENGEYACEIPKYLLSGGTEEDGIETFYALYAEYGEDASSVTYYNFSGETLDDIVRNEDYCFYLIDGDKYAISYDLINANGSSKIAIYLDDVNYNLNVGDVISVAEIDNGVNEYYVQDDGHELFIFFRGEKYVVKENLCDKVLFQDKEYEIEYINGKEESGECIVHLDDDDALTMYISDSDCTRLTQRGLVLSGSPIVFASTVEYPIKSYSGITVDGVNYPVEVTEYSDGSGYTYTESIVYLDIPNIYKFVINEIRGSSMLVCSPSLSISDFTEEFINEMTLSICDDVITNKGNMAVYIDNHIFGNKEITKEIPFTVVERPVSSNDYYNLLANFDLYKSNGFIHIPLSLSTPYGSDLLQDDVIQTKFFENEKSKAINRIIDMEKDVYYPKYLENGKYSGSSTDFKSINEIRINLHFRTRNLESWKVNEDYNDADAAASGLCNWFVTDYWPYKNLLEKNSNDTNAREFDFILFENDEEDIEEDIENEGEEENSTPSKIRLQGYFDPDRDYPTELLNTSDLVGLLNFSNLDVYYQKSKIAKSFLRLSYYDSINPQNQNLLATSSVYMDEHRLFNRYISNSRKNIGIFRTIDKENVNLVKKEGDKINEVNTNANQVSKISVNTEYYGEVQKPKNQNRFDSNPKLDDLHRIGSEFIIKNKYETDSSSEGYYLYIFKEYSEKLKPKPIYMKVEFNHAGIGKTIPFIVPMKWTVPTEDGSTEETSTKDYKIPERSLTLNSKVAEGEKESDLAVLKKGIKLEDAYAQSYIPLYAVYDFKNKEYAYVFDSRYVNIKDNVLTLNLFEIKFANDEEVSDKIQKNITYRKQVTAYIDNQFEDEILKKQCKKHDNN